MEARGSWRRGGILIDMSGLFRVSLLELTRICKASGEQGSRLQMFCVLFCKNLRRGLFDNLCRVRGFSNLILQTPKSWPVPHSILSAFMTTNDCFTCINLHTFIDRSAYYIICFFSLNSPFLVDICGLIPFYLRGIHTYIHTCIRIGRLMRRGIFAFAFLPLVCNLIIWE